MRIGFAAVVAAVLLAGTACGTAAKASASNSHGASSAASAGASTGAAATPSPGAGLAASLPKGGVTAGAGAKANGATTGYPQYVQGTIPARVTISLGFQCVRPGLGQTMTIHTTPGFYVAFSVQYADGSDGKKDGGMGYTVMPSNGTWTQAWSVNPSAPSGKATIFVSVEGGHPVQTAFRQPTFEVGSC